MSTQKAWELRKEVTDYYRSPGYRLGDARSVLLADKFWDELDGNRGLTEEEFTNLTRGMLFTTRELYRIWKKR